MTRPIVGARINLCSFYCIGTNTVVGLAFWLKIGFGGIWYGLLFAQSTSVVSILFVVFVRTGWEAEALYAKKLTSLEMVTFVLLSSSRSAIHLDSVKRCAKIISECDLCEGGSVDSDVSSWIDLGSEPRNGDDARGDVKSAADEIADLVTGLKQALQQGDNPTTAQANSEVEFETDEEESSDDSKHKPPLKYRVAATTASATSVSSNSHQDPIANLGNSSSLCTISCLGSLIGMIIFLSFEFRISKYFLKFALLHNNTSLDLSRSTMWLKFCLAVLILSNVAVSLESAVSSKDLGSKWMKAAVVNVKPGQSLISIPINEMSKKKSRVLVAFQGGNRLLGEEAARIIARYPDKAERKGLLQAAKLAVIKVLLLINEHSGTALQNRGFKVSEELFDQEVQDTGSQHPGWIVDIDHQAYCLVNFVISFSFGIGSIPWVLMLVSIKGLAGSVSTLCNWVITMVHLPLNWSKGGTFTLYTTMNVFSLAFVTPWVPKTEEKTFKEAQWPNFSSDDTLIMDARFLFDQMHERDTISWNTRSSGYAEIE
ncbi:hypothetical protein NE237_008476 [Protea cynaroides]|uniref:Multidrug and toxic compound extrusion protein n=1 Tax=Protea cynaroides TaxID=273540 RepID=A0A9Q0KVY0_9MAGN|nr:hypothetical protein NE237_008476 [Protea cynaroides]